MEENICKDMFESIMTLSRVHATLQRHISGNGRS